jgi:hypothetical protein
MENANLARAARDAGILKKGPPKQPFHQNSDY